MAGNTNRDRKKEEEKVRFQPDFVPTWPNSYFEQQEAISENVSSAGIVIAIIVGALIWAVASDSENGAAAMGIFVLLVVVCIILFFVNKAMLDKKKWPGTTLLENGTSRRDLSGKTHELSYEAWNEAIRNGGFSVTPDGIRIRAGREKLRFSYEVGDSRMQAHIISCYDTFRKHIAEPLPPLTPKDIGLLDHRYFYRRTRRQQTAIIVILEFFFLCCVAAGSTGAAIGAVIFIAPILLYALYKLFKGAKLEDEVNEKLKTAFTRGGMDVKKGEKWPYLTFCAATAAVSLLNLAIILWQYRI